MLLHDMLQSNCIERTGCHSLIRASRPAPLAGFRGISTDRTLLEELFTLQSETPSP